MARPQNTHDIHERLWKKLENGLTVWIVNGRLVRSVFDIDFTAGGHDHVYEFVPEKEIWIDDAIIEQERAYVLLHELHERNCMSRAGLTVRHMQNPVASNTAVVTTQMNFMML